jgi:hypothetical protein
MEGSEPEKVYAASEPRAGIPSAAEDPRLLAEREGFEPSVQVLARTTV